MKIHAQVLKHAFLFMLFAVIAGYFALPGTAWAQDDPPGRVARLNFIEGSVSFQLAGSDDWISANPNRPLTTGDNLWVDRSSRAELHIGSTSVRLGSETGISFLNLDDRTIQIQLAQGTIEIHLRRWDSDSAFEVDTPNLAFTLTRAGEYRIQANPDGDRTIIVVREGEGEVTGGGETFDLRAGQRYIFRGVEVLSYDVEEAAGFDDFETWCQERDQRENASLSARYVSRDVDGYYDLDDYGDWRNDAEYGGVWFPRGVEVGWVPYHYGHFVWISPWGWTWVGEEPWGFAPYHYGRWVLIGGYWGWVPGPIVVRPVYAPALVAFVGGGGASVAVGFGGGFAGVAWFPLGPRDVWVPAYRCSPRYVQNVNVTNTRVVNVTQVTTVYNNVYVNKTVNVTQINYTYANRAEAITAVRREDFVSARPVAQASVRITQEQIVSARPIENAPVAPTRASYVSSTAKVVTAKPPVALAQKPVVTKINPPAPAARGRVYTPETPASTQGNQAQQGYRINEGAAATPANAGKPSVAPAPSRTPNEVQPSKPYNPAQDKAQSDIQPSRSYNPPADKPKTEVQPAHPTAVTPPAKTESEAQPQQHPAVKFTPPVKAKDEMYDVHPPLNQKATPPPKEKPQEEKKDKDKDKDKDKKPPK